MEGNGKDRESGLLEDALRLNLITFRSCESRFSCYGWGKAGYKKNNHEHSEHSRLNTVKSD